MGSRQNIQQPLLYGKLSKCLKMKIPKKKKKKESLYAVNVVAVSRRNKLWYTQTLPGFVLNTPTGQKSYSLKPNYLLALQLFNCISKKYWIKMWFNSACWIQNTNWNSNPSFQPWYCSAPHFDSDIIANLINAASFFRTKQSLRAAAHLASCNEELGLSYSDIAPVVQNKKNKPEKKHTWSTDIFLRAFFSPPQSFAKHLRSPVFVPHTKDVPQTPAPRVSRVSHNWFCLLQTLHCLIGLTKSEGDCPGTSSQGVGLWSCLIKGCEKSNLPSNGWIFKCC